MYAVITQAVAAERARELQAHAAAARRARHLRRSQHDGSTWRIIHFPRGRRAPALPLAGRPLRGPRAA